MVADGNLELLAYALLATFSPVGFAATLAVIGSGRATALVFGVGFVGAQLATLSALVGLGTVVMPEGGRGHPTFRAVLELGFGLALLVLAGAVRRRPEGPATAPSRRTRALLDRLRRLDAGMALAAGILLGIGGPKRLVLTALAATAITASGHADDAGLAVAYSTVATLLVWAPILAFELGGSRVVGRLSGVQHWLTRHQRVVAYDALLAVGAFAVGDALVALL